MPITKLKAFPRGRPRRAPTSHQERGDRPISQDSARKVSKSWNRKRPRWSQVLHKKGEGRTRWLHVLGRLPSGAVSPGRARPIRAGVQPPLTPRPPPPLTPPAPLGLPRPRQRQPPPASSAVLGLFSPAGGQIHPYPKPPGPVRDGHRGLPGREQHRARRRRWVRLIPLN